MPSGAQRGTDLVATADASVGLLVVDSHAPSRIGLAALLKQQVWVGRCLLASADEEAVSLARRHRPDVAILDVSRTGPFAGTATAAIRAAHPGVCLLLSSRCRTSLGAPPASLGAVGFLPAGITGQEIVDRVQAAVLGSEQSEVELGAGPELSDREREILVFLGSGLTNREIGARLHLGPDSIKKSASMLYRKLGVRNRTEAVHRAATVLSL